MVGDLGAVTSIPDELVTASRQSDNRQYITITLLLQHSAQAFTMYFFR